MQLHRLIIGPGEWTEIVFPGDYVRLDASATTIRVEADGAAQVVELKEGDDARLRPFKKLRFLHSDAAPQSVVVYVGDGTQKGSSRVGGNVTAVLSQVGTLTNASAAVTDAAAAIVPASATRRAMHVRNTGAADVYLGGSAVTPATAAVVLQPGEEYREADAAGAEWWAVCAAGQASTMALMESMG